MKTNLNILKIVLPFLFMAFQISAQETAERKFAIGMHVAPTCSTINFNSDMVNDPAGYKPLIGCITGISGQFNFCPRLALHAELNYEKTGYIYSPSSPLVYNDMSYAPHIYYALSKSVVSINHITLPVSLKFNFVKRTNICVFVNAGTYVNYTYSYNINNYYGNGSESHLYDSYSYKQGNSYGPGALLGLGTDIRLCKRMHLTLEVRDHLNLKDIDLVRSNAVGLLTGLSYVFPGRSAASK
jgi:hypothetical protein